MTWCKSYNCRRSATERTEYCVSCIQMFARNQTWPDGGKDRAV